MTIWFLSYVNEGIGGDLDLDGEVSVNELALWFKLSLSTFY
jgi:hypothetical protein